MGQMRGAFNATMMRSSSTSIDSLYGLSNGSDEHCERVTNSSKPHIHIAVTRRFPQRLNRPAASKQRTAWRANFRR